MLAGVAFFASKFESLISSIIPALCYKSKRLTFNYLLYIYGPEYTDVKFKFVKGLEFGELTSHCFKPLQKLVDLY